MPFVTHLAPSLPLHCQRTRRGCDPLFHCGRMLNSGFRGLNTPWRRRSSRAAVGDVGPISYLPASLTPQRCTCVAHDTPCLALSPDSQPSRCPLQRQPWFSSLVVPLGIQSPCCVDLAPLPVDFYPRFCAWTLSHSFVVVAVASESRATATHSLPPCDAPIVPTRLLLQKVSRGTPECRTPALFCYVNQAAVCSTARLVSVWPRTA